MNRANSRKARLPSRPNSNKAPPIADVAARAERLRSKNRLAALDEIIEAGRQDAGHDVARGSLALIFAISAAPCAVTTTTLFPVVIS